MDRQPLARVHPRRAPAGADRRRTRSSGRTSNPTIFQKAMGSGEAYDGQLSELDHALPIKTCSGRWPSRTSARPATCSGHLRRAAPRRVRVSLQVDPGLAYERCHVPAKAIPHPRGGRPPQPDVRSATMPRWRLESGGLIAEGRSTNVTLIFLAEPLRRMCGVLLRGIERSSPTRRGPRQSGFGGRALPVADRTPERNRRG